MGASAGMGAAATRPGNSDPTLADPQTPVSSAETDDAPSGELGQLLTRHEPDQHACPSRQSLDRHAGNGALAHLDAAAADEFTDHLAEIRLVPYEHDGPNDVVRLEGLRQRIEAAARAYPLVFHHAGVESCTDDLGCLSRADQGAAENEVQLHPQTS